MISKLIGKRYIPTDNTIMSPYVKKDEVFEFW